MMMSPRSALMSALFVLGLCGNNAALAADVTVIYRCPNNDYYNNITLSEKQAKEKGCKTIQVEPVTIPGFKPRSPTASSGPSTARVDPAEQRARDADARRILEAELRREEERLAAMKLEYNNGVPDKQGAESKNYQKYLDRVADMKAAITRKEGDIAALKRELLKYPQ